MAILIVILISFIAAFWGLTMKCLGLTLLLISLLPMSCHAQDEDFLDTVVSVPGNFTIVVLFSVHETNSSLYYPKCGHIQDQAGMQRVEAALWELKEINKLVCFFKHNITLHLISRKTLVK